MDLHLYDWFCRREQNLSSRQLKLLENRANNVRKCKGTQAWRFFTVSEKIDLYIITRIDTLLSNSLESVFDKFHIEVINLSNVNK